MTIYPKSIDNAKNDCYNSIVAFEMLKQEGL